MAFNINRGKLTYHHFTELGEKSQPALDSREPADFTCTPDSFLVEVKIREDKTMRSIAVKLFIVMAITAIAAFGADSSVGTWKYNAAKSTTTSTNPTKSQTDVREATPDGGVKITRTGELADGTSSNYTYTYKYDSKEYPVTGAPFDAISVKRIDANTTSWEVKKTGGKYHVTGRTVISKDGKTMTQTSKGTDADGKPVASTIVFDKQ
jgi:hypothetical protein